MRLSGVSGQLFWLDGSARSPVLSCAAATVKVGRAHLFLLAAVVLAATVAAVAGLRWRSGRSMAGGDVIDAAPADAWLVVTVDMAAASPLLRPLLGGSNARRSTGGLSGLVSATRVAGLGRLSDACGFEPLDHMRELMVALPEGGERGEFGAAFSGDLTKDALAGCAEKVIRARGGRPSTTTRAGFALIADASDPKLAQLAYRAGGPFLIGHGAWLEAMVDAADGRGERARSEHAALRTSLSPSGSAPRALAVTALLPKSLRDRIKAEMDAGAGAGDTFSGGLGLLAVEEGGLAITAVAGGATTVDIELRCEAPEACDGVKSLIERKRQMISTDLGVRLLGLGALLDALTLELRGKTLVIRTHAPTEDVAGAIERLLGALGRGADGPAPAEPLPPGAPPPGAPPPGAPPPGAPPPGAPPPGAPPPG